MVRSVKYIRLRTETSKNFSKQGTVCSGSRMRGISSPVWRLRFLNTLIHCVSYSYVVTTHRSLVLSSVCRQRQALGMAQSPTSEVKGSQLKPITNSHLDVRIKNVQSSISYQFHTPSRRGAQTQTIFTARNTCKPRQHTTKSKQATLIKYNINKLFRIHG